ncbi:hypothetical protein M3_0057 [Lysinibacillus phage vB_LfM_LysYB1]|nr:hypothetical protein M3_0057 [Lysinibacillus phage vB_LfM_LysYB1]WAB25200.1 hypothetical protein M5_0022 [Lysinibacillus phage vB_LfM_LysYB2]
MMSLKERIKECLNRYTTISDEGFEDFYKLYSSMPYFSEDMEFRRDNVLFVFVFVFMAKIQYAKEGTYGNSWEKRKEVGVFMNMARKFDRLENMIIDGKKDEVGESKADTVADEGVYSVLWLTYILRESPEEFTQWMASI